MKDSKHVHRKRYEKPVVSRFQLRAEEAVLGSCKTSGNTGPGPANCLDQFNSICRIPGS